MSIMEDHNSPEAIAARANQEDPIVMYLIVRESLGMGMGKTAAQCAHASQMLTLEYFEMKDHSRDVQRVLKLPPSELGEVARATYKEEYAALSRKLSIMGEWLNSSFRKVVLRASDKEWEKLKLIPNHVLVVDAGLTEIAAGSETVIGVWPMRKSARPKILTKLQVLK